MTSPPEPPHRSRTSLPGTTTYIALNQFAGVLSNAVEAVSAALSTEVQGTAVVVFNPLNIEREDMVEAAIDFPGGPPEAVRVSGSKRPGCARPDGKRQGAFLRKAALRRLRGLRCQPARSRHAPRTESVR